MNEAFLDLLRCPATGEPLHLEGKSLVSESGRNRYAIDPHGIPLFAKDECSDEARIQEAHYDNIAKKYLANLSYPHTEEYMAYFDRVLLEQVHGSPDTVVEICCGAGEAAWLLRGRANRVIGLDISTAMLAKAAARMHGGPFLFVQGDACRLPIASGTCDAVFMLGGVHHVNARATLFAEIFRILKPGGRLYFREPLDDFVLWRLLRAVIYRLSPTLEASTERPLRRRETEQRLTAAGFAVDTWLSVGFLGCCFLMNSDVLVFNRLFRFIPGIRALTRFMTNVDEATLKIPGLRDAGVAVVGVARKGAPA